MNIHPLYALAMTSVLALPAYGCVAGVVAEPEYAVATDAPADIETYPSVVYEGRPVYFVNDRWYYRQGPEWVYYRREPAPLYRQRDYVRQAPRARPRVEARPEVRRPEYAAPAQRSERPRSEREERPHRDDR